MAELQDFLLRYVRRTLDKLSKPSTLISQVILHKYFKGLVARCHSFYLFYINRADIQYLYILLGEYHSCYLHCFRSVEGLLWGAEPRFELATAVQQADALLSEPRRTLILHKYF